MKKLLITVSLSIAFAVSVRAATTTNLLSLTSVTGTNAGNTVTASGVSFPLRTFIFQSGPITNLAGSWGSGSYTTNGVTNAITRYWQVSLDAANWVNVYTNAPTTTNATVEQFTPVLSAQTVYYRVIAVTTNALPVATFMQQN